VPWKLPESDVDLLALAKSYPYPAPDSSYLFADGEAGPIERAEFEGRVPVLAHGSNRSPVQLKRKFGSAAEIPVSLGWLADYDVVYSAHITQYGAVASTLQHRPGTRVRLAVNWLDEAQLARMHETEGPSNYGFGRLVGIDLSLEHGPVVERREALVYLGRNGCLDLDDGPVGLAAVTAEGRGHHAHHQEEALALVRARHRPEMGLEDMILEAVRDSSRRLALTSEMKARAVPVAAPHFEELGM
jgi:hypothetical protein